MEQRIYDVMRAKEDRHWWFRGRRAVIRALLARSGVASEPRILDTGCGTGRNLETYAALGRACGVDPSPEAIEYCRGRGFEEVHVGEATDLPFGDGEFDLVAATDVLEHVEDDAGALAETRRVTRENGRLLLTVPALERLWSAEDVRLEHHRRYNLASLTELARRSGWVPVFSTYFNTILLPPIALSRRLSAARDGRSELERTPASLDAALSLPLRAEARLIRRGLRLPVGVSIGLILRPA